VKRFFLAVFVVGLITAALVAQFALKRIDAQLNAPMSEVDSDETFEVAKGTSLRRLLGQLEERGLVGDAQEAYWVLRYERWRAGAIPMPKAGEFEIHTHWSLMQLLKHLRAGKVKTYSLTIPEGLRVAEIVERLAKSPLLNAKTLRTLTRDAAFADQLKLPQLPRRVVGHPNAERFEGWLFPTTYTLTRSITEPRMLQQMVAQTRKVLADPAIRSRAKVLGWSDVQVLSMASVVEKETGKASERPIISGAFHNRLRQGIRLETDPTIIYGIVGYDGNIRRKHIRMRHPWNCYVHHGLPATPIAAPGRAAIEAAVNPAKTKAIFFVSRNDGSHVFCPTLRCHRAAVNKWQVQYFRNKKR
jgi:UPF0755 protein